MASKVQKKTQSKAKTTGTGKVPVKPSDGNKKKQVTTKKDGSSVKKVVKKPVSSMLLYSVYIIYICIYIIIVYVYRFT